MMHNADTLLDRIRIKRQLTRWKILAVLSVVVAALALLESMLPSSKSAIRQGNYIASYRLEGFIAENTARDELLDEFVKDKQIKALILHIDSPGGTVVGGERLYQQVRRISENKPVVVVMHALATSAAYMTAVAADHLIAHEGSVTGSVGVILQTADITELADKLGIKPVTFKSAPLKATPNPVEPLTEEAAEATRDVVNAMMDFFVTLVQNRRHLDEKTLAIVKDGRIFTGRQALQLGLIDAIGNEQTAVDWLSQKDKSLEKLEVRDMKEKQDPAHWLSNFSSLFGGWVPLTGGHSGLLAVR